MSTPRTSSPSPSPPIRILPLVPLRRGGLDENAVYVYPEKLAAAQVSFSQAPSMMGFFSDTFGEYPFLGEVYGTALAEVGGAMENFTCTTYGQALVTGPTPMTG